MERRKHISEIKRLKKIKLKGSCILNTCVPCNHQCEDPNSDEYSKVMDILDRKLDELERTA